MLDYRIRKIPIRILRGIQRGAGILGDGFIIACGALIGLVVYDNLTLISTKYIYHVGLIAGAVTLLGIWSREKSWGPALRKQVFQTIGWLFTAMGLTILAISAERQLNVFDGSGFSLYNFWVADYLVVGMVIPALLFILAKWNQEAEDRIDEILERRRERRVPTLFDAQDVGYLDNSRWARLKRRLGTP